MLDSSFLYASEEFRAEYEEKARINMKDEIFYLEQQLGTHDH